MLNSVVLRISFDSHSIFVNKGGLALLTSFDRWGTWGTEKANELLQVKYLFGNINQCSYYVISACLFLTFLPSFFLSFLPLPLPSVSLPFTCSGLWHSIGWLLSCSAFYFERGVLFWGGVGFFNLFFFLLTEPPVFISGELVLSWFLLI